MASATNKSKYFGFSGLSSGSYDLDDNVYWVPVLDVTVNNKGDIFDELAKLERSGTPHRVLQYHKDLLIVEKKVELVN